MTNLTTVTRADVEKWKDETESFLQAIRNQVANRIQRGWDDEKGLEIIRNLKSLRDQFDGWLLKHATKEVSA